MNKNVNSLIFVFCPESGVKCVSEVLTRIGLNFCINDYDLVDFKGLTVCHFDSINLNEGQRAFLVHALEFGASVEPLLSYIDRKYGYTEIKLLNPAYFFHQKAFSILSNSCRDARKRVLDWVCVFLIGLIALPVGLLTALAIRLESSGPIFFKQLRTGRYNKEFEVIKFRSMRTDAEKDGAKWAAKNDSRVTWVGRFIRKTRIDELPQLINVIRGEMSLVGPRPEREVFIQELEKTIPYYRFRHAVRPGITGLAQVKYAYGASLEDAEWKHRYDMYYIKHRRFLLDVKIILLTIKTVLFGMGR